ncbi:helix-turn-helix domain-containing protein [Sphingobacterium siyangense]|uniref:helix-turn-helix domain-containing protein n=1 Tax=Sphingobacterium siyangense TaxID=459529 RepID=UPI001965EEA1|nr:helix-turn-helix domain-containing protein [Sphingobacterium siyangense]QRY59784.1 helix-turn-helix domain-containing protein [Sphingobacterium siyangense]
MKQLDKIVALLTEINNKLLPVGHHLLPAEQKNMEWNINALLTRMAVVSKLGISERTYNRWVKAGILVPIQLGNKHYYREQDLQEAIRRSINKGLI